MDKFKSKNGGWQAKIGPGVLSNLLNDLNVVEDNNVILDFTSKDDASVYKLGDTYLFQTVDFFTPNVEDPYLFGQIVAANSLSDIYAMGANPVTCQSVVAFPKKGEENDLTLMMKGCCDKLQEAGVSLTGGHSIYDDSVKFGLSVLGIGKTIWKNNGVDEDDVLILTKKIGSGVIVAAENSFEVDKTVLKTCTDSMTELNKYAKEVIEKYSINSCTDITGFGLLGHLQEMLNNTEYSAKVHLSNIPFFDKALDYASNYVYTSSAQENRRYLEKKVVFNNIDSASQELLFDAQTSGGLLFSVNKDEARQIIAELKSQNIEANIIGSVYKDNTNKIEVNNEHI